MFFLFKQIQIRIYLGTCYGIQNPVLIDASVKNAFGKQFVKLSKLLWTQIAGLQPETCLYNDLYGNL